MSIRVHLNDRDLEIINYAFDILLSDYDGSPEKDIMEHQIEKLKAKLYKHIIKEQNNE